MTALLSCDVQATDADWAHARQKYVFGEPPSGEFEEYAFSLFDATREVSA
jgi:hypothetical protein